MSSDGLRDADFWQSAVRPEEAHGKFPKLSGAKIQRGRAVQESSEFQREEGNKNTKITLIGVL